MGRRTQTSVILLEGRPKSPLCANKGAPYHWHENLPRPTTACRPRADARLPILTGMGPAHYRYPTGSLNGHTPKISGPDTRSPLLRVRR